MACTDAEHGNQAHSAVSFLRCNALKHSSIGMQREKQAWLSQGQLPDKSPLDCKGRARCMSDVS